MHADVILVSQLNAGSIDIDGRSRIAENLCSWYVLFLYAIWCVFTTNLYQEDVPFLKSNSHRVSPLVSVDGQDAVSFFREQGAKQSLQDPDARYNSVFKTYNRGGPENAILSGGIWQYPEVWPGQSSYAFKFENGTVRNIATEAILHKKHEQSGFNFPNGKAIFRKICASESKASSLAAPSSSETPGASSSALFRTSATPTPSSSPSASSRASLPATIPTPVMKDPYNNVLGFYLKEKGLQDVAVLLVSTFSAELDGITSFVDSVSKFLGQAVDDGKTRLVIDVTGNSGGVINLAYDLFKQLFPSKPIYGAGRFRNHEAMDFLGRAFEHITAPDDISGIGNLGIQGAATPNQTYHFKSWQELNGPHEELGVNVSSLSAKDFSRVASDKVPIHGYGSYKFNQTISPFKPENIVLVTDGFCASACTILAENLKWQGVKNVVFGGRPQRKQMQAIGGVKGYQVANSLNFAHFLDVFSRMQDNSVRKGKPIFTNEEMKRFNAIAPGIDSPPLPLGNIQVNMFNQYAPGDDDMPLHFVYEPADCRLFYTLDNIYNAATIWSTAAHTYWNNGPCVGRSTKAKLSASSSVSFSLSIPSATPTKSTSSS